MESDREPFGRGPVHHLDGLLFERLARAHPHWQAAIAFLVAWPPLVALAGLQSMAGGGDLPRAVLLDFLAGARYAISVPLLVVAESVYIPRLCRIHREFQTGGFVAEPDRERFERLGGTVGNLLGSFWMELAVVALAYGLTFGLADTPRWLARTRWEITLVEGYRQRSFAGWWLLLVSHPLFLVLALRSVLRLCAWTWMLWRISTLQLRLIPVHPDLAGGLRFVTTSVYALLPLALALGVLMAARATEGVMLYGLSPWTFRVHIFAAPIVAILVCAGPLLVFERQLWRLKVQGLYKYGVLATRVARRFEARWLTSGTRMVDNALSAPDFSATTDLFSIVSNARQSRLVLLDSSAVLPLVATVLIPFGPLLISVVPIDQILSFVWRIVV
jgi:hypothetical protein